MNKLCYPQTNEIKVFLAAADTPCESPVHNGMVVCREKREYLVLITRCYTYTRLSYIYLWVYTCT